MGFSIETSVSAVTVFLQGALSFFSPCVLPPGAAVRQLSGRRRR